MAKENSNKRDDILELNQETERNYEAAKNYYKQKRLNFFKIMSKQNNEKILIDLMTQFQKIVETDISAKWESMRQTIYDNVELGKNKGFIIKDTLKEKSIPKQIMNILTNNEGSREKPGSAIKGKALQLVLGNAFEVFTYEEMQNLTDSITNSALKDIFNNAKFTGDITSKSSFRQPGKNIRSDVGWYMSKESSKDGVALEEGTNIPIELQKKFEFKIGINNGEHFYIDKKNHMLDTYLNKSKAAGLLLKTWKYENRSGAEFGKASGLEGLVNKKFSRSEPKTWDETYAQAYANLIISKHLLGIIGPVNIALQTSSKLVWMDKFLNETIFYMTVSFIDGKKYLSKGGKKSNEIHPEVKAKDSSILLKKTRNGSHSLSSVKIKNNDELTFYMKRKKINY